MNEAVSEAGELAALGFLGAVCWAISTLAAGGGALTFLPTASWLIEPQLIPPLLAIASLASSLQRCWLYRGDIELRIVAFNVPGLALGVALGAFALRGLDARWLSALVGSFLIVMAFRHFRSGRDLTLPGGPASFGAASFMAGALSAVVGASGPIMNPVYLGAGIVKQAMVGTKAASTLCMQLFKIGAFLALGCSAGKQSSPDSSSAWAPSSEMPSARDCSAGFRQRASRTRSTPCSFWRDSR